MFIKYIQFLFFVFLFSGEHAFSQCCSAGSPIGVGTYAGLVAKNNLRVNTFSRYTFSRDYYEGTEKLPNPILVDKSEFLFQGVMLSYGIIKRTAIDAEFGYFYKKSQKYINGASLESNGLSNGVVMLKYGILHSDSARMDISLGAGIKYPFAREPMYVNHVKLPIDIQPSTNAVGYAAQLFMKKVMTPFKSSFYLVSRYEYNEPNQDEYRYGQRLRTSLIYEYSFTRKFVAMMQARFEYSGKDINKDKEFSHSGSKILFVSPLVLYSINCKWHLSLTGDIPVYKYYNGTQLGNKFSVAVNLTRDFAMKNE